MESSTVNDYTEIVERLSRKQKWSYGLGHILNDICASLWFSYLLVFFSVLGFSPVSSGLISLIGQIADAIATPFIGYQSDKDDDFWLCKYGKRKAWHLFGTICVMLSFPFIFYKCIHCAEAHQSSQIVYYAAFVIIFQIGWASVQISHLSLIPDLTPNEHERTELTAIRYIFTVFSNIFVYSITWAVLHISSENSTSQIGPKDAYKFQYIVIIGLTIGFITSLIFHIFVKEVSHNSSGLIRRNLRSQTDFLKSIEFYQVAVVYMSTRLFVNISQIYIPMYLNETLSMPATSLAIIPLIMYLSSFKVSLIIGKMSKKLGKKISYFIGVICGVSACLWIWFGEGDFYVKYEIYPVALLFGASNSIMLITSLGVTADLIGQNTESGAFVYGAMSFADKLSNGLIIMAIQYIQCTINCSSYYRDVISFICGGVSILGFLVLISIKPFNNQIRMSDYRGIEEDADIIPANQSVTLDSDIPSI